MWAGDKIVQKKDINLSIAVATEDELFVPVIKHADEKTIKGIAREITELAGKVRTKSLKADEMQGGTFTINNTGSFGSVQSMGIINYPQAAILQVESIVKRPVIMENGMFGARDMVNLCLSLDHRVLDGLICGKFLGRVKEILENTSENNTSVYNKKLAYASFYHLISSSTFYYMYNTFPSNLTMNDYVLGIYENTLLIYGIWI